LERSATRIEQLRQQITEAEAALGAAQQQSSGLEERFSAELGAADARTAEVNKELARVQKVLEEGARQHEAALADAQGFAEQTEALESALDVSREEVRSLQVALQQALQATAAREEALRNALEQVSEGEQQLVEASNRARVSAADLERVGQQLLAVDTRRAAQDGQIRELERELATARADRRSLEVRLEQALIRADESEVTGAEFRTRKKDLESRLIGELEEARAAAVESREQISGLFAELEEARATAVQSREQISGLSAELEVAQAAARDHERTADASSRLEMSLRDAEVRAAAAEEQVQGLVVRLSEQENQMYGVQDRLRSVADALVGSEAVLGAVQAQLSVEQIDRAARESQLGVASQELDALKRSLQEERQVREEIERSLDVVESSMGELSTAGERAVQELETARRQAADQAAEAERWQKQCAQTQRELVGALEQAAVAESAPHAEEMDKTVGQLRLELEAVRSQGAALGAERARLMRQASLAENGRDAVAERLEAAQRAHEATAVGMEMVIARLESERERAEAFDRELRELRERVEERGEFTVKVTREAAKEAQRASQYRRELAEAKAQAESLRSELDRRTAELQSAQQGLEVAAGVEQGEGVADWDAEIQQEKLRTLEADQAHVQAELKQRRRAQQELEARLQQQVDRVQELLTGAEQHRLEMADREISLAEQAAWNAELVAAQDQTHQELALARQELERREARLTETRFEAKQLAAQIARLEGLAKRRDAERDAELEALRAASATIAADIAEGERAMESALQEAAAFAQRLEDTKRALAEREDRIEELQALLELAKAVKSRGEEPKKKRSTLVGIGPDTVEIPTFKREIAVPAVDLAALRAALDEVGQLEKTCQVEEERIGVLATSLERLGARATALTEQLGSERLKMAEVEQHRGELARQVARIPELELELDRLRTQSSSFGGAELAGRVEVVEQLLQEQKRRAEQLSKHSEVRITELNNTIGDKDAEILLLHASMESMQRRAGQLAANIQEALGGASAPSGGSTQALLDRVKTELEGLKR